MTDEESYQYYLGYKEGKQDALDVLRKILDSMLSQPDNSTSIIMNNVFNDIYEACQTELS